MNHINQCNCPVCLSWDHKIIFEKDGYSYSICKTCGYVFQALRNTKEHHEKLPYCTQRDYEKHSKNRAKYILKFCNNFVPKTTKLRILDIGCGRGGVMKYVKESLSNSYALGYTLDMNEKPFDKKLKIVYQNIEDIKEDLHSKYDFVIMAHVAEHFYDPFKAMCNTRRLMSDNSILYVEVPSFDLGEIRSNPIFSPEHVSYFTKNSLTNLLNISGFEVIKIKENKYWGNIKVIAKKYDRIITRKSMYYRYVLLKRQFLKLLYPLFRLNKRDKNND